MKKIISLIIAISLILSSLPVLAAGDNELKWRPYESGDVRRTPENNYHTMQNPPDFKWQPQNDAISYDIIVTKDKELKDVKYKKDGITTYFYNFPNVFEPGIYYWSVRYNTKTKTSQWAEPNRFLIDKDATLFPVPPVSELIKNVPESHPRILFNKEEQVKLREIAKAKTNRGINTEVGRGRTNANKKMPPEPTVCDQAQFQELGFMLTYASLGFALSGDLDIGNKAKAKLLEICSWDPEGVTSFATDDQMGRLFMVREALAYDWLYEILTEEERAKVLKNIEIRIEQLFRPNHHGVLGFLEGDIYTSHGFTASEYLIESLIAILYDSDKASGYLETILPIYVNLFPLWSTEDGGWSQGAYYWYYSDNGEILSALTSSGIIDITKKPWKQNEIFYNLYFWPRGALTLFGDDDNKFIKDENLITFAVDNAILNPSPISKWYRNEFADFGYSPYFHDQYIDRIYDESEVQAPIFLEKGKYLKDIGWIGSHSDLIDRDRISLYFKSSWFGSNSHSHADQNSFVIDAFGERLAFDSGYYDFWGSSHDRGYSRQTHAHNSITHSNGVGQPTYTYDSKGKISDFLTHPDFDLASGDATEAYAGKIDKFKRHIIYVRPDQFLIIDDLKAKDKEKTTFEFWLNSGAMDDEKAQKTKLSMYDNKKGARIEKDKAVLDASICYPEKLEANYSNIFSGTDMVEIRPEGRCQDKPNHERVWFKTENTNKTKIVTAMNVHKNDEKSKAVVTENKGDYLKVSFTDGTDCYINTSDKEMISADGYNFKGLAFAIKGNTVMLVDGNYLDANKNIIFESDKNVSLILGRERLGISSIENDAKIKVRYDNLNKVKEILDDKERDIKENFHENTGIFWKKIDNKYAEFNVYNGAYTFYLNGKLRPGEEIKDKKTKLSVNVNGNVSDKNIKSYYDGYDNIITNDDVEIDGGFYTVLDMSPNLKIKGVEKGATKILPKKLNVEITDGKDAYISFKAPVKDAKTVQVKDFESIKNKATIIREAEDTDIIEGRAKKYDTRKFLSGGFGLSELNKRGDNVTYNIDVKEEGYYKLAIKYVSWNNATRVLKVGDNLLPFTCISTGEGNYGQLPESWAALVIDEPIYLKKGINPVTLFADTGNWNMDFLAFIKQ